MVPRYCKNILQQGGGLISLYCYAIEKRDKVLMDYIDNELSPQSSDDEGYYSIAALRIGDIEMLVYCIWVVEDELILDALIVSVRKHFNMIK